MIFGNRYIKKNFFRISKKSKCKINMSQKLLIFGYIDIDKFSSKFLLKSYKKLRYFTFGIEHSLY